jgi:hypothetical protein
VWCHTLGAMVGTTVGIAVGCSEGAPVVGSSDGALEGTATKPSNIC